MLILSDKNSEENYNEEIEEDIEGDSQQNDEENTDENIKIINLLFSEKWADLKEKFKDYPNNDRIDEVTSTFNELNQNLSDELFLNLVKFFKNPENHESSIINKTYYYFYDKLQSKQRKINSICYFILSYVPVNLLNEFGISNYFTESYDFSPIDMIKLKFLEEILNKFENQNPSFSKFIKRKLNDKKCWNQALITLKTLSPSYLKSIYNPNMDPFGFQDLINSILDFLPMNDLEAQNLAFSVVNDWNPDILKIHVFITKRLIEDYFFQNIDDFKFDVTSDFENGFSKTYAYFKVKGEYNPINYDLPYFKPKDCLLLLNKYKNNSENEEYSEKNPVPISEFTKNYNAYIFKKEKSHFNQVILDRFHKNIGILLESWDRSENGLSDEILNKIYKKIGDISKISDYVLMEQLIYKIGNNNFDLFKKYVKKAFKFNFYSTELSKKVAYFTNYRTTIRNIYYFKDNNENMLEFYSYDRNIELIEIQKYIPSIPASFFNFMEILTFSKLDEDLQELLTSFLFHTIINANKIYWKIQDKQIEYLVGERSSKIISQFIKENSEKIHPIIFKSIEDTLNSNNLPKVGSVIQILRNREKFTDIESTIIIKAIAPHFTSSNEGLRVLLSEFCSYFQGLISRENQDLFNKKLISLGTQKNENFLQFYIKFLKNSSNEYLNKNPRIFNLIFDLLFGMSVKANEEGINEEETDEEEIDEDNYEEDDYDEDDYDERDQINEKDRNDEDIIQAILDLINPEFSFFSLNKIFPLILQFNKINDGEFDIEVISEILDLYRWEDFVEIYKDEEVSPYLIDFIINFENRDRLLYNNLVTMPNPPKERIDQLIESKIDSFVYDFFLGDGGILSPIYQFTKNKNILDLRILWELVFSSNGYDDFKRRLIQDQNSKIIYIVDKSLPSFWIISKEFIQDLNPDWKIFKEHLLTMIVKEVQDLIFFENSDKTINITALLDTWIGKQYLNEVIPIINYEEWKKITQKISNFNIKLNLIRYIES